jgi:hypothetical protein
MTTLTAESDNIRVVTPAEKLLADDISVVPVLRNPTTTAESSTRKQRARIRAMPRCREPGPRDDQALVAFRL